MRRHFSPIHEVLHLRILPIPAIPHYTLYIVVLRRIPICHIFPLQHARGIEGIEADLPTSLPLSHIHLRRPSIHRGEPKRRPRPLRCRRLETAAKLQTTTLWDRELLLCTDGAGEVVNGYLFTAVGSGWLAGYGLGGNGKRTGTRDGDMGLVHTCAAVVGITTPWVVVRKVLFEGGSCVKDGLGN